MADLASTNLLEDGVYELGLERDRLRAIVVPVRNPHGSLDRFTRGLAIETLKVKIVAIDVRELSLEDVSEPGIGILAQRDEHVRAQIRAPYAAGESAANRPARFSRAP